MAIPLRIKINTRNLQSNFLILIILSIEEIFLVYRKMFWSEVHYFEITFFFKLFRGKMIVIRLKEKKIKNEKLLLFPIYRLMRF